MTPKRHGNRWTINEILKLQREYELLGMSVSEIACSHERSINSIVLKIDEEGFVYNNNTSSQSATQSNCCCATTDSSSTLNIKGIVKEVVSNYMETRRQKQKRLLKPLRKLQTNLYI